MLKVIANAGLLMPSSLAMTINPLKASAAKIKAATEGVEADRNAAADKASNMISAVDEKSNSTKSEVQKHNEHTKQFSEKILTIDNLALEKMHFF